MDMTNDTITATITIPASAEAVFGILADPTTHDAIDGTGWVRESLDGESLTGTGQIFRVAMYHDNHPAKNYEMANKVVVFDRPTPLAGNPARTPRETGICHSAAGSGVMTSATTGPSEAHVTLTYDWSAVPPELREHIQFPPFDAAHLENSLQHLSDLAST